MLLFFAHATLFVFYLAGGCERIAWDGMNLGKAMKILFIFSFDIVFYFLQYCNNIIVKIGDYEGKG